MNDKKFFECHDCKHYAFRDADGGPGLYPYCTLHKKPIKGAGCKGKDFKDMYEKRMGK